MEFEGGQTRERAEHYAWLDVTAQIRHAEACVGGRELGD
jgi:hypothetical protein